MLKQFIVRKGKLNDLSEMQKMFADTVTEICKADYDKEQIRVWKSSIENKQRWKEILTKQFVLVAQYANKIVGFVTLEKGGNLDLLYVHKDYQRKGIANKLYDLIENEVKEQGQTILTSDVSKTARPFFERKGFKLVKEQAVKIKNVTLTNYKMEKMIETRTANKV